MMKKVVKTMTGLSKVKNKMKSMVKVSDETKTIIKSATLTSVITSICFGLVVANGSLATNQSTEDINQMKYQIAVLTNELETILEERSTEWGIGDYKMSDLYYSVETQVSSKPLVSIEAIEKYIGIRAQNEPKLRVFVGYGEEIYKSAILSKIEPGIFLIGLLELSKNLDEATLKRNNPGNVAGGVSGTQDGNHSDYKAMSFATLEDGILAAGKVRAEELQAWDIENVEDLSVLSALGHTEVTEDFLDERTTHLMNELNRLYETEKIIKKQSKL
ncbi:hypothetical protein [Bacillus cereus]|uniref:Uncharacterized protein n=1 Tax=Bacillus cereus TaxID=1396 RepID=A0A164LCY0_BACCE|nr:hypothetical protein [Bacillus cereus]KZD55681.1 hypothetical protein B4088_5426 [Bacillus cereus]